MRSSCPASRWDARCHAGTGNGFPASPSLAASRAHRSQPPSCAGRRGAGHGAGGTGLGERRLEANGRVRRRERCAPTGPTWLLHCRAVCPGTGTTAQCASCQALPGPGVPHLPAGRCPRSQLQLCAGSASQSAELSGLGPEIHLPSSSQQRQVPATGAPRACSRRSTRPHRPWAVTTGVPAAPGQQGGSLRPHACTEPAPDAARQEWKPPSLFPATPSCLSRARLAHPERSLDCRQSRLCMGSKCCPPAALWVRRSLPPSRSGAGKQ